MTNKQIKANIKELDKQIGELALHIKEETTDVKIDKYLKRMEQLIELRAKLAESLETGSIKRELISGAISVGAICLILKYEEANVITTKALGLATKLFRG